MHLVPQHNYQNQFNATQNNIPRSSQIHQFSHMQTPPPHNQQPQAPHHHHHHPQHQQQPANMSAIQNNIFYPNHPSLLPSAPVHQHQVYSMPYILMPSTASHQTVNSRHPIQSGHFHVSLANTEYTDRSNSTTNEYANSNNKGTSPHLTNGSNVNNPGQVQQQQFSSKQGHVTVSAIHGQSQQVNIIDIPRTINIVLLSLYSYINLFFVEILSINNRRACRTKKQRNS